MTQILAASGADVSHEELLDALWLAHRLPRDAAPLARAAGVPVAPPAQDATPHPAEPTPPRPGTPPRPDPAPAPPERPEPARPVTATDDTGQAPPATASSPALPVRTPETRLTGSGQLHLGKALRPLRQRFPDRRRSELDVARTVAAVADTGVAETVTRPVRTRWLTLALVIDDGVSMVLWQRLAADVRRLMERAGAFRDVRVYGLDTRGAVPALRTRPFRPRGRALTPRTLCDPSGNTLVLVVSDGVGPAWRDGGMRDVTDRWGSCGPVAIVHALPGRLWAGTGIDVRHGQVTTYRRGGPTRAWYATDPDLPPGLAPFDSVPVPVLTPTPRAVGEWARLLASPGGTASLPLWEGGRTPVPRTAVEAPDGDEVLRFREAASTEAYRLAAHVAAVAPVTPPVMRLVQHALGAPTDSGHLMEVFLGGLMHEVREPHDTELLPHHRRFDFTGEARRVLLGVVSPAELLRTSEAVTRDIEDAVGHAPVFPAWVGHPDGTAVVDDTGRSFGWLRERLLNRLGVSTGGEEPLTAPDGWCALSSDDPQRLGRFRLLWRRDRVGRLVTMYLAQGEDGRLVTVRTPVALYTDDPMAALELVRAEAECLRRLDGGYAPALVDVQADEGGGPPWIAAELVDDGGALAPNLGDVLAGHWGAVPEQVFLQIGLSLSWALAHVHELGLVHGSLAPSTVLVTDGSVRLIGWMTATVDGIGTPRRDLLPLNAAYLAAGASGPALTPESDMYAAGSLLLSLLAGERTDPRSGADGSLRIDSALLVTLRHCLASEPLIRPTARDLVRAFTAAFEQRPSTRTAEDLLDRLFDDIQRLEPLARSDLISHGPALAGRLMTFSNHLAFLGRLEESLSHAEQAVGVYRELAAGAPQEHTLGLGAALNNLSVRLGESGRAEESLAAVSEAARLYEATTRLDFAPGLSMILNNLSHRLAAAGRREEALAAAERAVDFGSDEELARAWTTLGSRRNELGRREDALDALLRATAIHRGLERRVSTDHAVALNNLAVLYGTLGRHTDALNSLDASDSLQARVGNDPQNALPQIRTQSARIRAWLTGPTPEPRPAFDPPSI
ncbi:tetratricopeptide repeat-containing protein kinase family protein [Streptomyces sp. NPDC004539]|uniref:tetratricopeptide repeat-containing protein kinase family protein n=1 Tax=Streptomyces sp. NPDC004539 TaxID=3154280 RepID=UPI0033AA79BE